MNEEIDLIENSLKHEESPMVLASFLTKLAAINSFYTEKLRQIQIEKPTKWLDIKHHDLFKDGTIIPGELVKPLSDKQTDMIWASTEQGKEETNLTFILKRVDILYRSINRRLQAVEQDFRQSRSQI